MPPAQSLQTLKKGMVISMNILVRIDTNIIAIIMLIIVYFMAYRRLEKQDSLNKIFLTVAFIVLHQLVFETITCIINKRPELWLIPISEVFHTLLFTVAPILTCYWYFLIKKLVRPRTEGFKKRYLVMWFPVLVNFILTLLSPIYHFIYSIDTSNVYHRGSLYLLSAVITYSYILYSLILVVLNAKLLPKHDFNILIICIIFPICGGLVQTFVYGPLLIWSCSAFSLFLAFIFLQQRMVHLDELTGAWDRSSFEYYIAQRLEQDHDKLGIIYVDIDKLKDINDKFGHMEGDYAIKMAVSLIRNIIHKDDIIVRQGGDEFLIIIRCNTKEALDDIIRRMEVTFDEFNHNSVKSYRLECSFGGDIFDSSYSSMDMFINHVDNLMYQRKKERSEKLIS